MGVYIHCPRCKEIMPTGDKAFEFARLAVLWDAAPIRGKSTWTIKCLRHGKVLAQAVIECEAPKANDGGLRQFPLLNPHNKN